MKVEECKYILRTKNAGVVDVLRQTSDLEMVVGEGLIYDKDYHVIRNIEKVYDFDRGKTIYIVDMERVAFEDAPELVRQEILWRS